MFTVTIAHVSMTPAMAGDILVFNGTSMSYVLSDCCDVLSFNLSTEEIVIILVNKSLISSQAVT